MSRINRGELRPEDAGQLVNQAIDLCRLYERATDGYFSAWIAGRFDPSGLVKGWAIDRACSILDRYGYRDYFVDAGGDVQTRGRNAEGGPWRVGIRHPIERDKVARVVLASGLAVATSGTYEKGEHILDPHSGKPANAWLSFTVVGPDILETDVYATACFAMGIAGLDFMSRVAGYEAYAIDLRFGAHFTGKNRGARAPLESEVWGKDAGSFLGGARPPQPKKEKEEKKGENLPPPARDVNGHRSLQVAERTDHQSLL